MKSSRTAQAVRSGPSGQALADRHIHPVDTDCIPSAGVVKAEIVL